ncbi:hypothetical protein QZN18_20530 [Klebsiella variicola]|uniref:hypothetical protein n=1 Tax=Klebsiella variicola TaxID=244366 RepID=UPI00265D9128|nr:hypothetical protein [Klebsiella variicola]WKL60376.1 hypothetical protein QZN18_20530 [Klebsiella variicola]
MTKSTITRERLEHYASLPSQPFGKGAGVFMYEVRQMARALLAAMNGEPVAITANIERDAQRYRFLRERDAFGDEGEPGLASWDDLIELDTNDFDAAIDARMAHPSVDSLTLDNALQKHERRRCKDRNCNKPIYGYSVDGLCEDCYAAVSQQPAPVVEREPIAWLNDAYLARGVVDGEAGSEDAGPGYIPVYREAGPQPVPVVPDDLSIFEAAIEECKKCDSIDEHAWNHGVLAVISKYESCRAAMLQAQSDDDGGPTDDERIMAIEGIIKPMSDCDTPVYPDAEKRIADAVELLKKAAPGMLSEQGGPDGPLVGKMKRQSK